MKKVNELLKEVLNLTTCYKNDAIDNGYVGYSNDFEFIEDKLKEIQKELQDIKLCQCPVKKDDK